MEWEIFGISVILFLDLVNGVGNFRDFQFPRHHPALESAYMQVSGVFTYADMYINVYSRMRVRSSLFLEF